MLDPWSINRAYLCSKPEWLIHFNITRDYQIDMTKTLYIQFLYGFSLWEYFRALEETVDV